MRDSLRRLVIAALPIFLFGCAAAPIQPGAPDSAFEVVSFTAPASVYAGAPYRVTFACRELDKVKVLQGNFFWEGEGPFDYPVTSTNAERSEVSFDLVTGKPGRYELTGLIVYKERLNGKTKRTKLASAGVIVAQ